MADYIFEGVSSFLFKFSFQAYRSSSLSTIKPIDLQTPLPRSKTQKRAETTFFGGHPVGFVIILYLSEECKSGTSALTQPELDKSIFRPKSYFTPRMLLLSVSYYLIT